MTNQKKQISVRLPPNIYDSLTDFLRNSKLTQTQVATYAIANFIEYQNMMKSHIDHCSNLKVDDLKGDIDFNRDDPMDRLYVELDDLKLDVEDITNFVEKIDYRLSRIEEILKAHRKIKNTLTETEKKKVQDFLNQKKDEFFTLKELIIYLGWNPEGRSPQLNVSKYLKRIGYVKKRRKIDGKHPVLWSKGNQ